MAIKISGTTVIGDDLTLQNLGNDSDFNNAIVNKALISDQVWAAQTSVQLTDAATIAVDMSTGINFHVTLAGNRTLGNPTNTKDGQKGRIKVIQDATGGRTLSFSANYEFANGSAYSLVADSNGEYDVLYYDVMDSNSIVITGMGDVF